MLAKSSQVAQDVMAGIVAGAAVESVKNIARDKPASMTNSFKTAIQGAVVASTIGVANRQTNGFLFVASLLAGGVAVYMIEKTKGNKNESKLQKQS